MKRLYLFALSCLACLAASAQTSVPRPWPMGANSSYDVALPGRSVAKPHVNKMPARLLRQLPVAPQPSRRGAPGCARRLFPVQDTLLLVDYTLATDGSTTKQTALSYDKYGLRRLLTEYDMSASNGRTRKTRYTYDVDDNSFWTRRVIETDYRPDALEGTDESGWYVNSTVIREPDAEGRLLAIEVDDPCRRWHKQVRYDYDHVYYGADGTARRGFEVERHETQDGVLARKAIYQWYEPTADYLLTDYESPSVRYKAEVFGNDSVRTTRMAYDDGSGLWQTDMVETDYYRVDGNPCTGFLQSVPGAWDYGKRAITIAAGDSVATIDQVYDALSGEWTNDLRTVAWGSMFESPRSSEKYYEYIDGEWVIFCTSATERISETPLMTLYESTYSYTAGYEFVNYNAIFPGCEEEVYLTCVDEETLVRTQEQDEGNIYTYYDFNGNVKLVTWLRPGINTPFGDWPGENDGLYTMCVRQPDGSWLPSDSFEYEISGGNRVCCTCNAQGYPERIIIYKDSPGNILAERSYTYTEHGYSEEFRASGILLTKRVVELMDDRWVSDITYKYNGDGSLYTAHRTDTWQNCSRTYTWDGNDFVLDRVTAADYTYTEADGSEVTILHKVEGNTAVPTTKVVQYVSTNADGLTLSAECSWSWDGMNGSWVEQQRTEDYKQEFDFCIDYGPIDRFSPANHYDDGPDGYDEVEQQAGSVKTDGHISYIRAGENGLVINSRTGSFATYHGGDEATVSLWLPEGCTTTVYTRNALGSIASEQEMVMDENGAVQRRLQRTFTYTPEGYLLTEEEKDEKGAATLATYTYKLRSVITGIDDAHPAATATLAIEGLAVSAPGHIIRLFNVQGAEVAVGEGSVSAPRAGLYIVKVGDASVKVVLK